EYRLHSLNATIVGGMILYPVAQAKEVLQFYRSLSANAPDELTLFAGLLHTPDSVPVVAVIPFWTGAVKEGLAHLKPLREFGAPLADLIGEIPYTQQQTLFDAAAPFGMRRYWKAGYCAELPDELLDLLIHNMAENPSPYSLLLFFQIHGAVTRVGLSETPFTARQNQWDVDIISQWQNAGDDEKNLGWARNFWRQLEPYTRGAYQNHFDADDGAARVRLAYGQNYERLAALKRKYDPTNLFRMNNNIAPV
ncbi:MAG TPA: BBE domain-containing protein, partial [Blastocatellia bacterium]|nr:BBE domain-containing protein [Blastocatellia bacterium]